MYMATTQATSDRYVEHTPAVYGGAERRRKPRLEGPFPAVVHGADAGGEAFELHTVIDNISAGGLYVRLRQRVEPGATLFFLATLSATGRVGGFAPRLALHGVALRAELTPEGTCGVAVAISHYRFL